MGVKSYVASLEADKENTILNIGSSGLEFYAKISAARDKTDVNRESKRIQESAESFINDLQYDRDYQGYEDKANEWFNEALASIQENTNLSGRARKELLENQLPILRESVLGKVPILQQNAHMAEIKVEVEQFGDVLASDLTKPLNQVLGEYRSHIEDLDLFNDVTIGKMVKEYEYSTAPIKALQSLQMDYMEKNIEDKYSFSNRIDEVAKEANLDASQAAALRKSALDFQGNYDRQLDTQFSEQKEILSGQLLEAVDNNKLFDTDSIDNFIEQVPARHKLELYKIKNTALSNNDDLIKKELKRLTDNNLIPPESVWELVDTIYDPYKRDEVSESLLVSHGSGLIAQGVSLVDARNTIDSFENVSLKSRKEAKAELTKQYLNEETDVSKVAKSLMDSIASSEPTPLEIGNINLGNVSGTDFILVTEDDQEVLIPAEIGGKAVTEQEAVDHYKETGEHLGKFSSTDEAVAYANSLEKPEAIKEDSQIEEEQEPQLLDKEPAISLKRGMSQIDLVTNALQIIKDGDGRYLTTEELALISDKSIRSEISTLASIRDSLVIDSPLALDFVDQLRRDENVSDIKLRMVVRDFVDRGFIKADTAESESLTSKYKFAENENIPQLEAMISGVVSAVYPPKKGKVLEAEKSYLKSILRKAVDDAVAMNPDLMGKDFDKLQNQISTYAINETSRSILSMLDNVSNYLSEENINKRINNLSKSDVSTFLSDVQEGRYDLLINWDFIQQTEVRAFRNDKKDVIFDKVTTMLTPYKNFKELEKNGTRFEKLKVMANSSMIVTGGTLEKALTGSFGISPSDMKLVGRQWAFSDPEAEDIYFIATDTDIKGRGTLGWGMVSGDYDGIDGLIMFKDYVDPKLAYEIESLEAQINDPLFPKKKKAADVFNNQNPLGMGGLGYSPVRVQKKYDDRYYGVIEEYEKKIKEREELMKDIITYRFDLLGQPTAQSTTRL